MPRRQHEERVVRIIAAIEGERVPISEVSVPRAELPIDVVMTLGLPSRAWGPLRLGLAHRRVCVEHYSGSPGIASLSRSLAKHAFVVEEWWGSLESALVRDRVKDLASRTPSTISMAPPCAEHEDSVGVAAAVAWNDPNRPGEAMAGERRASEAMAGEPQAGEPQAGEPQAGEPQAGEPRDSARLEVFPPALLVLSAGYPRQALSGRLDLPPSDCPGIWYCHRPLLGDIILVHLRGLPAEAPGCALLRFMATPTSPEEAQGLIAGLMTDRTMLDSERNKLMEQAMDGIIPTTMSEKVSILDRIRAEAREELRKEVGAEVEKSLSAFARSVLKVLEARGIKVKPSERKRIRACRDLETLEAWHDKSFQVASASELFK